MPRSCARCGCTDERACTVDVDGVRRGCRWVAPGLCSACSGAETRVAGPPPAPQRPSREIPAEGVELVAAGYQTATVAYRPGLVLVDFGSQRPGRMELAPADALAWAVLLKRAAEAAQAASAGPES